MGLSDDAKIELEKKLKETFKTFDADNSGQVDTKEIEQMMKV